MGYSGFLTTDTSVYNISISGTFYDIETKNTGISAFVSGAGGLMGYCSSVVGINNVTTDIIYKNVNNSGNIGGICGIISLDSPVGNLKSKVIINDTKSYNYKNVGGIFGYVYNGNDLFNVTSQVYFNNASSSVGGLLGNITTALVTFNIYNSNSHGTIINGTDFENIGGLIGEATNSALGDVYDMADVYTTINITGVDSPNISCDVGKYAPSIGLNEEIYYSLDNCDKGITNPNAIALTNTQMLQDTSYGLNYTSNFDNTWIMVNGYWYPELRYFWKKGSVILYKFYDISTNLPINDTNMTIITDGNTQSYTNTTVNQSELLIYGLSADNYTLSFLVTNYDFNQFLIDLDKETVNYVDVYLLDTGSSAGAVTFTVKDSKSGMVLNDANVKIQRKILGVWMTVASYNTDIVGNIQFTYQAYKHYRFIVSKTGYTTKTFDLNPITSSTYTVLLTKVISEPKDVDYAEVSAGFTPELFYNNKENTITFLFYSPNGEFNYYGFNITYPTGHKGWNSSAYAKGEIYSTNFNISTTDTFDSVEVRYYYNTNDAGKRVFVKKIRIIFDTSKGLMANNLNNTYGLGDLERVLIGTTGVLLLGGTVAYYSNPISGFVLGLFLIGFYTYSGFWTWQIMVGLVLILATLIVAWRSST